MPAKPLASLADITRDRELCQIMMLSAECVELRHILQHLVPIAIRLIVESAVLLKHPPRPAACDQRRVKGLVHALEIVDFRTEYFGSASCKARELVQARNDTGFPFIAAAFHRQAQRFTLDHTAHQNDIGQILTADLGDAKSPLSDSDNKSLRDETRQPLPDRRRANSVILRKIRDDKLGIGRQAPRQDIALKQSR